MSQPQAPESRPTSDEAGEGEPRSSFQRIKRLLIGKPKDLDDPKLFHQMSLVAVLAWVGLGADGLSSSAYGPEEAYRALGEHTYLAVFLAMATAFTVFIISRSYHYIIEHFPYGGGYVVSSKLLGAYPGLLSGCALLVDYVLTISISIASGGDALFSFLPVSVAYLKFPIEVAAIVALIVMNLRGVKESVTVLLPIFLLFVFTHVFIILVGVVTNLGRLPAVAQSTIDGVHQGVQTLGVWGLVLLFLRAYSMGGGTYTGIEAVSNGVNIMQEPKVATAQKTMVYMAASLAFTAGGILLCYQLAGTQHVPGMTMNAVLIGQIAGGFHIGIVPLGHWFVVISLLSETLLLFVAAQAGFIDGPRVMANMALDNWLPRRFASLSDRLTIQNGVLLIGAAALSTLYITSGSVSRLVVMYSINVFLTFSLSNLAMCRFWRRRAPAPGRVRILGTHVVALLLCCSILIVTVLEKFTEGGWLTILLTSLLFGLCLLIKGHYRHVATGFQTLTDALANMPSSSSRVAGPLDPAKPVAILLVGGYSGLGVHSLLSILRSFPDLYKAFHFVSVGVIDTGNFKGKAEVENLRQACEAALAQYVSLANKLGFPATSAYAVDTDVAEAAEELCTEGARRYRRNMVFAGKLVFEQERWYYRLLHNETATELQRRLQWKGQPMVILPVRVIEKR